MQWIQRLKFRVATPLGVGQREPFSVWLTHILPIRSFMANSRPLANGSLGVIKRLTEA